MGGDGRLSVKAGEHNQVQANGAAGDPQALFDIGFDFKHHPQGAKGIAIKARVWAHPKAAGAKVPLLVALHGNNAALQQDHPMLFGPKPDGQGFQHLGKLLTPLIDDEQSVTPLVIAAPSRTINHPWPAQNFDLSAFVTEVRDLLAGFPDGAHVDIDLDKVAVAGHSAAGGGASNGLNRVAEHNCKFNLDGEHTLYLFGVMDTLTNENFGTVIRNGLAGNDTKVYVVRRPGGGWGTSGESQENFCKGLLGPKSGWADFTPDAAIEKEQDNLLSDAPGDAPHCDADQRRISITLHQDPKRGPKRWTAQQEAWKAIAGAYHPYDAWSNHFDCVVMWTVWAGRRYFAPPAAAPVTTTTGSP
jgi:hypothetical protein